MSRKERIELMTSVVTKLDEAAILLTQAEASPIKWTSLPTLSLSSRYLERNRGGSGGIRAASTP